jgi:hypothetical protein
VVVAPWHAARKVDRSPTARGPQALRPRCAVLLCSHSHRGVEPVLAGRRTLERGATPPSRNAAGASPRGESGPCDPPRPQHHRRICAPGLCRPGHPYSPRRRAQRGHERRPRSRLAEAGPGRAVPARLRRATPRGACWRPSHIALPRLGLRAEKCTSGDALSMPAPARVMREPVRNQLGGRVIRASVANQRLRGRGASGAFFELTPSR